MLGLIAISHQLPSVCVPSDELVKLHGFEAEFISDKLGIDQRFKLPDDMPVSALASEVVNKLCRENEIDVEALDLLIVVTQTGDYCLPHVSAIVQAEVGMRKDVFVMDINLGCSGYVMGLASALAIMEAQHLRLGIVVTVDAYSRIVSMDDRATSPLFGDGASATLIGENPRYLMGKTTFGTDGSQHELLIAKGTGSTAGTKEPLFMDGRGIFNFALRVVPTDIKKCLELNNLDFDDVDLFILHQANAYMVKTLGQRMGIPDEKLVLHLREVGNTTSSSIPIALEYEIKEKSVSPSTMIISGFGVGLSWATSVLRTNEERDYDGKFTR